jgi:hypothetical protein
MGAAGSFGTEFSTAAGEAGADVAGVAFVVWAYRPRLAVERRRTEKRQRPAIIAKL